MRCTNRTIALGLLAAALAAPVSAEPTPAPPDWQDGGASVYDRMKQTLATKATPTPQSPVGDEPPVVSSTLTATEPMIDTSAVPAAHQAPQANDADSKRRHLAPPSTKHALPAAANAQREHGSPSAAGSRRLADLGLPTGSLYTMFTALAVVIGAFLIFAWALRRGGRKAGHNSILPSDVVSMLGRVPIAARHFAVLLRVGNKLVLVSLTPTGPQTITEVTDPVEVDRLVGLCQQCNPHSTTKAFEQVFQQLSRESPPGEFFSSDALPPSLSSAAAAYRTHRGDSARA